MENSIKILIKLLKFNWKFQIVRSVDIAWEVRSAAWFYQVAGKENYTEYFVNITVGFAAGPLTWTMILKRAPTS